MTVALIVRKAATMSHRAVAVTVGVSELEVVTALKWYKRHGSKVDTLGGRRVGDSLDGRDCNGGEG